MVSNPTNNFISICSFHCLSEPSWFCFFDFDVRADQVCKHVELVDVKDRKHLLALLLLALVLYRSALEHAVDAVLALVFFDEVVDAVVDARDVRQLPDARPLRRVFVQHRDDQHAHVGVEFFAVEVQRLVDDLVKHALDRVGVERLSEQRQLVQDAADGPDVGLLAVRVASTDLGRHEVRRADVGLGQLGHGLEFFRDAEVADLEDAFFGQKHVLSLQVAVQDVLRVHQHHAEDHLRDPVQHSVGVEWLFICFWRT